MCSSNPFSLESAVLGAHGGASSSLFHVACTGAEGTTSVLVLAIDWQPHFVCTESSPEAVRVSSHGGSWVTEKVIQRDRKWTLQTQPGSEHCSSDSLEPT